MKISAVYEKTEPKIEILRIKKPMNLLKRATFLNAKPSIIIPRNSWSNFPSKSSFFVAEIFSTDQP